MNRTNQWATNRWETKQETMRSWPMRRWLVCWLAYWILGAAAHAATATLDDGMRLKNAHKFPAAAAAFKQLLAQNPGDVAAREQLAIVDGVMGHYSESITEWERVLQADPQRPGARIGLARSLYWNGEWAHALSILNSYLAAHPNDYDALVLRGDVLLAEGHYAEAHAVYLQARALRPGVRDAELERKIDASLGPTHWRIDAGGTYAKFTNFRNTEGSGYLQVGYRTDRGDSAYLRYERLGQFGEVDQVGTLGLSAKFPEILAVAAELGGTPSAKFLPTWTADVELDGIGVPRVQPLLGYRYRHYDTQGVSTVGTNGGVVAGPFVGNLTTITPGIRVLAGHYGNLEARYSRSHNLDGSNTGVVKLRWNFAETRFFAPYIGFDKGDEVVPPEPRESFKVYSAGSTIKLTRRWAGRIDIAYDERPGFYYSYSSTVGVSYMF